MSRSISRRQFLSRSVAGAVGISFSSGLGAGFSCTSSGTEEAYDLLISGGTVIDGTGNTRIMADVAVRNGYIAKVGNLSNVRAAQTLDATGRIVTPGFIDMHSHSDWVLLQDGLAHSAVRQGVTTLVNGNCGGSPAPTGKPSTSDAFRTFGDYLARLDELGTSVNVCSLIGHNTLRTAVMGVENRVPTPAEMDRMKELVAEAIQSGAVGMSTGLISAPGTYAATEELVEQAKVVAQMGGIYATHMRGEAGTLVESVEEALRVGREAGVPVQISHHKAVGKENWGTTEQTLKMIEKAHDEGVQVRVDVYPYVAGSANLSQFVAPWAHEGGTEAMLARLKDPDTRARIKHDMIHGSDDWHNFFVVDWQDIQIARVKTEKNQPWVGKRIADVARARGISGYDACIDLLIEEEDEIRMINFIIDEEEMQNVLKHPLAMVGSDGRAVSPELWKGNPHPRFYGCFPRVLGRYCRDLQLFSLETAVYKMTGMPARQLALSDRGIIREGHAADLTIFNFDTVIDNATFEYSSQYSDGIEAVVVNGRIVIKDGRHLEVKPGRIL